MLWFEEHFKYEIRLDQIAADVNLSNSYTSCIFHQETGSNITNYIAVGRLKKAHFLLETTTLSVEDIGRRAGFISPSYFANQREQRHCSFSNNL